MWGWLRSLVEGFVKGVWEPILTQWNLIRLGRAEERADAAKGAVKVHEQVEENLSKVPVGRKYVIGPDGRVRLVVPDGEAPAPRGVPDPPADPR